MAARALILDFGGVISRTLFETHPATEAALGLAPGTLTWRGPFDPASDPLWQSMQAGEISERDYYRRRTAEVAALVGAPWQAMADFVRAARGGNPERVIRPEASQAIDAAARAGKRVAILSNELDLFYGAEFRQRLPFLSAIDVICDGTHTGVLKPDAQAYQACLQSLGLPPGDCVFVDDQPRNIDGARAVGLQAVAFDVRDPRGSFARALARLGIEEPSHG